MEPSFKRWFHFCLKAESVYVKLLDVGASDTFTIAEGQHIEIQEPAVFVLELVD
jgi:hypothetical protein